MSESPTTAGTPVEAVKAMEVRYLDPAKLHFEQCGAQLRLTVADEFSVPDLKVVRVFPISDPERYLSLRDAKGNEIGIIADPARLEPPVRALVGEAVNRRYLMPVIARIVAARERFGIVEWVVETDRGRKTFMTRNLREEVMTPSSRRYLLKDVDGNRYDIPDFSRLDGNSQGLLMQHL